MVLARTADLSRLLGPQRCSGINYHAYTSTTLSLIPRQTHPPSLYPRNSCSRLVKIADKVTFLHPSLKLRGRNFCTLYGTRYIFLLHSNRQFSIGSKKNSIFFLIKKWTSCNTRILFFKCEFWTNNFIMYNIYVWNKRGDIYYRLIWYNLALESRDQIVSQMDGSLAPKLPLRNI